MKNLILFGIMLTSFSNLFGQTLSDSTEIENDVLLQDITITESAKAPVTIETGLKGFDLITAHGNFYYLKGEEYILTDVSISLGWSQFMYRNTAIGVNASYKRTSRTTSYNNDIPGSTYSNSYSMFGPNIGYYYGTQASKLIPFIDVEYDFYVGKITNYQEKKLGIGCIFQVKPKVGISLGVDYIINQASDINIQASLGLVGLLY